MGERSFGPTVLVGLAGATLATVAAARDWAVAESLGAGVASSGSATGSEAAPLALALALVALAAWGAVLVLRGRVRNVVAILGLVASVGVLAVVVDAFDGAQDAAADAASSAAGATGDVLVISLTGWYWATAVGAVLCVGAFAVAARRAAGWPAMGTRYDAPSSRSGPSAGAATEDRDLWRALDEGHDPTA